MLVTLFTVYSLLHTFDERLGTQLSLKRRPSRYYNLKALVRVLVVDRKSKGAWLVEEGVWYTVVVLKQKAIEGSGSGLRC